MPAKSRHSERLTGLVELIVAECCRRSSAVCLRKELLRFNVKDFVGKANVLVEYLPDGSTFIAHVIPARELDSLIIATHQ